MPRNKEQLNKAGRRSGGKRGPSRPPAPDARIISLVHASREYGLPYASLRDRVASGELPRLQIGKRLYIKRVDLEAWIDRNTTRIVNDAIEAIGAACR